MRYFILLLLNIPIILLAVLSVLTKYKTKKITKRRFYVQTVFWILTLVLLIVSFPLYNYLAGNDAFESAELTMFDIVQTTAIVYLVYAVTRNQQKIDTINTRAQDLHQEVSIKFSKNNG